VAIFVLMIRGSQTVTSIFPNAIQTNIARKSIKGVYTEERDICLCYRYYYHYEIQRIRMDDAVAAMEKEFFISASTIMARLVDYADLLKDIVNNKPTKNTLRRKYPQFVWN
jgi:hypothetical protein